MAAVDTIARVLEDIGRFYNGFEAHGVEHIPLDRPAFLVFYHGLMPLDAWYFQGWFYNRTGRLIHGMGDRFLFKTPGLKWLVETMGGVEGNRDNALRLLAEGQLIGASPGGVREAIAPRSQHYKVLWKERMGFAHVATQAQVPVIPAFCENVEELYRSPGVGDPRVQQLYEQTRLPIVPIAGLGLLPFPVKLRAWVGAPIAFDPNRTPEQLRDRTKAAIESLIAAHQGRRPRILRGLGQRVFPEL